MAECLTDVRGDVAARLHFRDYVRSCLRREVRSVAEAAKAWSEVEGAEAGVLLFAGLDGAERAAREALMAEV